MIITRTPFRISFFGGGTDYPAWYQDNKGAVLATTINKYCYLSIRYLPPFFDYNSRIVWSKIELVKDFEEIQHPSVRAILRYLAIDRGVAIHHDADLPARSGLGSSSAFTVGLVNAINAMQGKDSHAEALAKLAIHIEQDIIKEAVGSQDQVLAAHGGFNQIEFLKNRNFKISPMILKKDRSDLFQRHLMLFFTGFSRFAPEIAKSKIAGTVVADVLSQQQQ